MARILFDISRIFIRGARFSPTGIDRVVVAYARWLLGRDEVELQPVLTFGGRLYGVSRPLLDRTIRLNVAFARRPDGEHGASPAWTALREALCSSQDDAPPLRARPISQQLPGRAKWHLAIAARAAAYLKPPSIRRGDIYMNVSHTGLDQPNVLGRLADRGVAPVVMVHDLIPICFPEYCAPPAERRHLKRANEIIAHARLIITNSATTAADLTGYARAIGRLLPPLQAVPLGIEAEFTPASPRLRPARPYFVSVGTLEARKNLAFLLALWRRLADGMGPQTPRLVLVGRRGWENESVIDHLNRSKSVTRLVHETSDLSDAELAQLIGGSAGLLAPSLAEGFDLPVVEALALRAPVIGSDIPAHREFAGGVATLLDPLDGPAWLAAVECATASARCGPTYAPPRWDEHFAVVEEAIAALH